MGEAVDAGMDSGDLEEETDEEVSRVLNEVLAGKAGEELSMACIARSLAGKVGQLPSVAYDEATPVPAADAESEEDDLEGRLQALRS